MITEDYVSFETAKLLKEKGFESDECIAIYDLGDNNAFIRDSGIFENGPEDYLEFQWGEEWKRFGYYLAPTLQMVMKWLRNKYKMFVLIEYSTFDFDAIRPFLWSIREMKIDGGLICGSYYSSYEKACEAAIKYALENLI